MYTSISEFDRLIQFLPVEIRPEVQIEIGTPDQSRVVQSLWRFPWQKYSRFAIDISRWQRLSADQQKLMFLREAVMATELALGDNWSALLLYPALIGAGAMGIIVELQLGDNLGMGLAAGLAASAGFLLRRAEKGQKSQIIADEFAVRYAAQHGYSVQQAAALLLSAIQQIAMQEERTKEDYDTTIRRRNLEFLSQRGFNASGSSGGSGGALTINPKYRSKSKPQER
ncbi:MAG: DUF3318 domain-containing protein [Synechococcaceae cyanobacterium SM2_3_1]|nr:DUF3318 domain-containing protein [Synechococcaceae cyanobacterium SM2_3_1]